MFHNFQKNLISEFTPLYQAETLHILKPDTKFSFPKEGFLIIIISNFHLQWCNVNDKLANLKRYMTITQLSSPLNRIGL